MTIEMTDSIDKDANKVVLEFQMTYLILFI